MLVILGIGILVISFVIALISLVREERKREHLFSEINTDSPPGQEDAQVQNQPSVAQGDHFEKGHQETAVAGEVTKAEPFPWEAGGVSSNDDSTSQEAGRQPSTVPDQSSLPADDKDQSPMNLRFPTLGEDKTHLTGSFKVGSLSDEENS